MALNSCYRDILELLVSEGTLEEQCVDRVVRGSNPGGRLLTLLAERMITVEALIEICEELRLEAILDILKPEEPVQVLESLPDEVSCVVGDELVLSVKATGRPKPQISWYLDGKLLPVKEECLRISKAQPSDEGLYHCVLQQMDRKRNRLRTVFQCTCALTVRPLNSPERSNKDRSPKELVSSGGQGDPPVKILSQSPRIQRVCEGSVLLLFVDVDSSADVRYVRFRDDVPIPGSDCSELLVGPVPSQELGHVGVYHCEVRAEGFSVLSERMSLQFDDQPPGQPSPPSKIALLMGNMAYANETVLLRPKTDLKILREALSQAGFVVVALLDLTLKEMRNGLSLVADLIVPGAYVFFHFAGHGFIGGGEQYLMPIDSHRDGRECVSISDVQELFLAKDPGLCVLTLDTCRRRVDGSCFFRPRELKANTRNLVKLFSSSVSEYAREQLSFETTLFVKQLAKFLPQPKPLTEVLVQIWHGYASTDQVPTREINLQDSSKSLFDPIDWSRGEQRRLLDVCKEGMLQTNLLNTKVQDVEFSITFGPMLGFIANVYELAIEGDQARCFQLKHVSPDSIRAKLVTSSTNSRLKQWEVSRVATCKNLEVDSIELLMSFQKNPESEATELTCEVPLPVVWKGLCEPVEDAWWTDGSLRVDLETGGVSPCALLSLLIASSATGNPGLALKKEEK